MADFKFCTTCGRKVALDAQFCAGCGAALGAKEKSVQAPTQKASAAAPVKKETAPTQQELTAKVVNEDENYLICKHCGVKLSKTAVVCYHANTLHQEKNARNGKKDFLVIF
jgi:hypothetical protein